LTIRTYSLAAPILIGRRWSLIEDHINFSVGKQAYLIGDLANSVMSLRRSLTKYSRQPAERQSLFVREYLVVLKQYLAKATADREDSALLRNFALFPLPVVRFNDLQVMLGKPVKHGEGLSLEARGIQFTDADDLLVEKRDVESYQRYKILRNKSKIWEDWMEGTDVSDCEDDIKEDKSIDSDIFDANSYPNHVEPSASAVPGLLEEVLMRAEFLHSVPHSDKKKKSPSGVSCRPQFILYTNHSISKSTTPVAPVGEYVTVRIPLENPMRIPLVFSNLHLLWSFGPQLSNTRDPAPSDPCSPITNETPFDLTHPTRHIVANEVIPELIMLPNESKATNSVNDLTFRKDLPVHPWLPVPISHGTSAPEDDASSHTLSPGASVTIPVWFRAPHLSSSLHRSGLLPVRHWHSRHATPTSDVPVLSEQRTVHLVFQYTSLTPNPVYPELNTRFVRHRSDLELQPSLRFKALATRKSFSGPRDIFIHLIIQNLTSNTFRSSFEILQISCASRFWVLKPVTDTPKFGKGYMASLAPGEVVSLSLHGSFYRTRSPDTSSELVSSGDEVMFSTVPLSTAGNFSSQGTIVPSSSPYVEFYSRSGCVVKRSTSENENPCKSRRDSRKEPTDLSPVGLTQNPTQLVQFRLHHPFKIHNRFPSESVHLPLSARSPLATNLMNDERGLDESFRLARLTLVPSSSKRSNSLLKIPVHAELLNTTMAPVLVRLEAVLDENR
uniref:Arrestin_N domain-containing protein n=1 Tax=Echinostoma caproni TaxID=27848 RepID=A0A183ADP0_9TREM